MSLPQHTHGDYKTYKTVEQTEMNDDGSVSRTCYHKSNILFKTLMTQPSRRGRPTDRDHTYTRDTKNVEPRSTRDGWLTTFTQCCSLSVGRIRQVLQNVPNVASLRSNIESYWNRCSLRHQYARRWLVSDIRSSIINTIELFTADERCVQSTQLLSIISTDIERQI